MRVPQRLTNIFHSRLPLIPVMFVVVALAGGCVIAISVFQARETAARVQVTQAEVEQDRLRREVSRVTGEDQYVRNEILSEELRNTQSTYAAAVRAYESLIDLRSHTKDTGSLDASFATILSDLSKRKWATGAAELTEFTRLITAAEAKLASSATIPANVPENNSAPGSGFSRQKVTTDAGAFLVDLVAADMGSTRVIVDTASDGTCTADCPALSLSEYVSRSGAFAGINGTYFCPADYPSCADKKNSFDTLLMNKNKTYFNSDNNVYSTVPAVIFLSGSMRFVGRSSDWGRDTSPDGVLAMQPLLVSGGQVVFGGDGDPKKGSKGNRSFVANKGTTAYIGVVYSATVAESAHALQTLGMDNALNLDNGGSTALWSGGYKAGPGRNIPNAILFVRK